MNLYLCKKIEVLGYTILCFTLLLFYWVVKRVHITLKKVPKIKTFQVLELRKTPADMSPNFLHWILYSFKNKGFVTLRSDFTIRFRLDISYLWLDFIYFQTNKLLLFIYIFVSNLSNVGALLYFVKYYINSVYEKVDSQPRKRFYVLDVLFRVLT